MWYEVLPTLGIFSFFIALPIYVPYATNYLWRGKLYKRTGMMTQDLKFTMRDERITGDYYKHQGLESIPDE